VFHPQMPKGVEHAYANYGTEGYTFVFHPQMPKGVEHKPRCDLKIDKRCFEYSDNAIGARRDQGVTMGNPLSAEPRQRKISLLEWARFLPMQMLD
jgi:hypothetical protein